MKKIEINDLIKAQSLKAGESLITSNYIIVCINPLNDYKIYFKGAKK